MYQNNEITTRNPVMQHHKYSNEEKKIHTHRHTKKKLEKKKKNYVQINKQKEKEKRTSKCYFHVNKMYPD
jgi:hypothetical protein